MSNTGNMRIGDAMRSIDSAVSDIHSKIIGVDQQLAAVEQLLLSALDKQDMGQVRSLVGTARSKLIDVRNEIQ